MKKSKKDKPRPRWYCEKCGMMWVSAEKKYIDCILCGTAGEPLNESAEKMLRKEGLYGENIP
jgi:hypothetical protein